MVVGNDLVRRKSEVVFVELSNETWLRLTAEQEGTMEIEQKIVDRLIGMHTHYIAGS